MRLRMNGRKGRIPLLDFTFPARKSWLKEIRPTSKTQPEERENGNGLARPLGEKKGALSLQNALFGNRPLSFAMAWPGPTLTPRWLAKLVGYPIPLQSFI